MTPTPSLRIAVKRLSAIHWTLMILALIILLIVLVVGFFEGRKAYWDGKIKEMCERDGGVTIYEKISVPDEQYKKLPKVAGSISIPPKALMKAESSAFSTSNESVLRSWQPRVTRREQLIKRRLDSRVIGKIISYSRVGGDFPTVIGHPTSFNCPDHITLYAEQAKFFSITGVTK